MKKILLPFATGFGLGYLPAAGTFGSLWGILFVVQLALINPFLYAFTLFTLIILSIYISDVAEKEFGHDSGKIVIDEVVGMAVAISFMPLTIYSIGLGFVLFRLLDILKPYPIRLVEEKFKGGLGVVLDDLAAGVIANILLRFIFLYL